MTQMTQIITDFSGYAAINDGLHRWLRLTNRGLARYNPQKSVKSKTARSQNLFNPLNLW